MSHSYTDDTIDSRRSKQKSKTLNRGHSLEDSAPDGGGPRLKAAVSESMLSGDSTLGVPDGRKATSKLSLIGDKLGDAARALTEKGQKKSKTSFTIFRKRSSRDPSPNDRSRTRSQEYGSLDRNKVSRSGAGRSPNRGASTLPITRISDDADGNGSTGGPMINMEVPRGMIPYEFQESMGRREFGSDGSDPDLSETDLMEMNAWAEHVDEYFYSVRIFPGQDPSQVYVGWMTSGFNSLDSQYDTKKTRRVVLSLLDQDYRIKSR